MRDEAEKRRLMKEAVLPPIQRSEIEQILLEQHALNRIAPITSLVDPIRLIALVSQAESKGMSSLHLARKVLEPGAMVATETNMKAFKGLGNRLIGYQLHCVTDKDSRPWHQARKEMIYYIYPREGQKGLFQMPRPPYEPDDPAERPVDAPILASCCRCFLSPVCRVASRD